MLPGQGREHPDLALELALEQGVGLETSIAPLASKLFFESVILFSLGQMSSMDRTRTVRT